MAKTDFGAKYLNGKIDFFYFFIHLSLDILSKHGSLAFITTNYWLTASDAKTLRNDLMSRSNITDLLNFKNLKIFSSALGQHNMITFASKSYNNKINTLVTNENGVANNLTFDEIVNGNNKNTDYGVILKDQLVDPITGYFILDSSAHNEIITNIIKKLQYTRRNLLSFTEKSKLGLTTGSNKTFIWKKEDINNFEMSKYERSLFKPLINGSSLKNVREPNEPDSFVLYLTSKIKEKYIANLSSWIRKNKNYPRLAKRREVINKKIRDIDISWPRNQSIFENRYSIYVQKRSKIPRFTLNNNLFYVKDDSQVITLKKGYLGQNKYIYMIITVLNSTIAYFWLVKLGRKKGKALELYPEVLSTIPMPNINEIPISDLIIVKKALKNGTLLSISDSLVMSWFKINSNDLKNMKEYIKRNQ